jgi:hypothetical protein
MHPTPPLWDSVAAPWRASDLHECVRLTRAAVDAEPYELAPRYLLAALYLAVGEPGLALLQYERLLPLAIGRGELFLALAAQRRLDELHPPVTVHQKRFHAMHQWFVSLARSERRRRGAADRSGFGPHVLVSMPAKEFARAAERCHVEAIAGDPRVLTPESGLLWVVLHGRVRWTVLRDGQPEGEPLVSEAGDFIVLPSHVAGDARVRVEAETPAECLSLDPALFVRADDETAAPAEVTSPSEQAAIDELVRDLMAAAMAPLDIEALTADLPPVAPIAPVSLVDRPVPDPFGEPTAAVAAPEDRRRETRFSVHMANRVVTLGLAGTRVAPLIGALAGITPRGMAVRFRRGDVLQAGHALRGSVVSVHLGMAGGEGTQRLAARVSCAEPAPGPHDPESALALELEFMAMSPATRVLLEHLEPESHAA